MEKTHPFAIWVSFESRVALDGGWLPTEKSLIMSAIMLRLELAWRNQTILGSTH